MFVALEWRSVEGNAKTSRWRYGLNNSKWGRWVVYRVQSPGIVESERRSRVDEYDRQARCVRVSKPAPRILVRFGTPGIEANEH